MDYETPLALHLVGSIKRELIDAIIVYNYCVYINLQFFKSKTQKLKDT